MKVAFLGAGRIASAMVSGLLAKKMLAASDLACLGGANRTAADLAQRTGIELAASLDDLLAGADTLVVAFKPQTLATANPRLGELSSGRLVISILAGKRLARLQQVFPRARAVVRCMPNTPAQIGAGVTAWCTDQALSAADRATVTTLLGAMGRVVEVPEAQMDAVTAVSGSGPAYVFEFAAALRDGGIAAGLDAAAAETLAVETLLGAAKLLEQRKIAPEQLRDEVVSPNGTTFAGLQRMKARDFRGVLREVVLAAKARSEELSKD